MHVAQDGGAQVHEGRGTRGCFALGGGWEERGEKEARRQEDEEEEEERENGRRRGAVWRRGRLGVYAGLGH